MQLLSVRAPASAAGKKAAQRTILDYGVLETEGLSPARAEDQNRFAAELLEAVIAFEPRLENPTVEVRPVPENGQVMAVRFIGQLRLGSEFAPFEFISNIGGVAEAGKDG